MLAIVLSVIANLYYVVGPLLFGQLLNEIQANGITDKNIWTLFSFLAIFFVLHLGFWALHGPSRIIEGRNAFLVRKNYKEYLLKNVLALDMAWHSDRDSGDTIDKIEKGTKALFEFSEGIFIFVEIIVRAVGTIIVLYYFNLYAGLTLTTLLAITLIILMRFDTILVRQYQTLNLFENKITAKIFDGLSNITSVLILRIQNLVLKDVVKSIDAPYSLYKKNNTFNEIKWFTGASIFELSVLLPVALFLYFSIDSPEVIAVGTVSALYMYVRNTGDVFFGFAYHYEDILRKQASVQNAEELEQYFTNTFSHKKTARVCKQLLEISDLTFSYDKTADDDSKNLREVSLSIKAGERIALVGASGSGKTTFLKILHGLYPVQFGKITVDGKQLRKSLDQVDLGTTLVPQEPELFSATILENITLGIDTPDTAVAKVLELAAFTDVVESLPEGLASKINEKGVNLSGGQKQRLALARALLFATEKTIILMDESTSSVDPHNERIIYKNIFRHFTGTTIIATIHKFNLLEQFDRIILFNAGEVVADGTLKQLIARNEMFKKLWQDYQSSTGK